MKTFSVFVSYQSCNAKVLVMFTFSLHHYLLPNTLPTPRAYQNTGKAGRRILVSKTNSKMAPD